MDRLHLYHEERWYTSDRFGTTHTVHPATLVTYTSSVIFIKAGKFRVIWQGSTEVTLPLLCVEHLIQVAGNSLSALTLTVKDTFYVPIWLKKSQFRPNYLFAAVQPVCWIRCGRNVGWDGTRRSCACVMILVRTWGGPALLTSESSLHGQRRVKTRSTMMHIICSQVNTHSPQRAPWKVICSSKLWAQSRAYAARLQSHGFLAAVK